MTLDSVLDNLYADEEGNIFDLSLEFQDNGDSFHPRIHDLWVAYPLQYRQFVQDSLYQNPDVLMQDPREFINNSIIPEGIQDAHAEYMDRFSHQRIDGQWYLFDEQITLDGASIPIHPSWLVRPQFFGESINEGRFDASAYALPISTDVIDNHFGHNHTSYEASEPVHKSNASRRRGVLGAIAGLVLTCALAAGTVFGLDYMGKIDIGKYLDSETNISAIDSTATPFATPSATPVEHEAIIHPTATPEPTPIPTAIPTSTPTPTPIPVVKQYLNFAFDAGLNLGEIFNMGQDVSLEYVMTMGNPEDRLERDRKAVFQVNTEGGVARSAWYTQDVHGEGMWLTNSDHNISIAPLVNGQPQGDTTYIPPGLSVVYFGGLPDGFDSERYSQFSIYEVEEPARIAIAGIPVEFDTGIRNDAIRIGEETVISDSFYVESLEVQAQETVFDAVPRPDFHSQAQFWEYIRNLKEAAGDTPLEFGTLTIHTTATSIVHVDYGAFTSQIDPGQVGNIHYDSAGLEALTGVMNKMRWGSLNLRDLDKVITNEDLFERQVESVGHYLVESSKLYPQHSIVPLEYAETTNVGYQETVTVPNASIVMEVLTKDAIGIIQSEAAKFSPLYQPRDLCASWEANGAAYGIDVNCTQDTQYEYHMSTENLEQAVPQHFTSPFPDYVEVIYE